MLTAIALWVGLVVGLGVLLVMALGPLVVEIDARRQDRRHQAAGRVETRPISHRAPLAEKGGIG